MGSVTDRRIPRGRTWALSYREDRALYLRNYQTSESFRSALDRFEMEQHSYIRKRETRVGTDGKHERREANWQIVELGPDAFPDTDDDVEWIDAILAEELETSDRERLESNRAELVSSRDSDIERLSIKRDMEYVQALDGFIRYWKLDLLDAPPKWLDAHGIQLRPPPIRVIVHDWVISRFLEGYLIEKPIERPPLLLSFSSLMPPYFEMTYPVRIDITDATYEETVHSIVADFKKKLHDNLRPLWEDLADAANSMSEDPDHRQDYVWFSDTKPTDARNASWLFDLLVTKKRPQKIDPYVRRRALEFAERLGIDKSKVFPKKDV